MKSVLITGCSEGGIGSSLAEAFLERGLHVFATARDVSKMSHLKKENVTLLALDVTNPSQISAVLDAVKKHGNTLDYLVNNSGRNFFMPTMDINIEDAKKMFDTNLWGALAIMQAFCPLIVAAKGTIINICSIAGHVNVPFMGIYAASKRSLEILSETLRLEMAPFGVKVVEIVTGAVASNGQTYFGDLSLPPNSIYQPIEDVVVSRAQGHDGHPRMATKEFATLVVNDVLKGAVGRVWRGNDATTVKWSTALLPQSLLDMGMVKDTGLNELAKLNK